MNKLKKEQVIKDLSGEYWINWRDDETLIKFLKSKRKMNPTKVCEEVNNKFNLNTSVSELGAIKHRHHIFSSSRKETDNWKKGMDIDKAFEGEDELENE